MPPQPRLAIIATVQQAISTLLTTYEPEFLRFGFSLFVAFATILLVWQGIRMMLNQDSLGSHFFDFAKLLLFISFGYALIAFYESPLPGIGVSFSNLITDQAHALALGTPCPAPRPHGEDARCQRRGCFDRPEPRWPAGIIMT